jgi:hypothetical protein
MSIGAVERIAWRVDNGLAGVEVAREHERTVHAIGHRRTD